MEQKEEERADDQAWLLSKYRRLEMSLCKNSHKLTELAPLCMI